MKRKLLLAALCVVGALGFKAHAQESGTKYYLYNEDSGSFLSRGAAWGTHATADTYGIAFEFTKINDGVYTLKNVDHSLMANTNKYLGDNLYTDNGTACNFTFVESGGKYTIYKGSTDYLTIDAADSYGQKPIVTTTDATAATKWTLMTVDDYNTALTQRDNASIASLATALGFTGVTDLTSLENYIAIASTVDKTSSVGNAAIGGGSGAWTKSQTENNRKTGDSKAGNGVFQTWNGCVDINQTVSNLDPGLYMITVEAFLRFGDKEAAKRVQTNGSMTSYLYGNDSKTLLKNFWDVRQDNDHPNSMAEASSQVIDANDKAKIKCYTRVGDDGKLKLGIYLAGGFENVWMICDNFTLTKIEDTPTDNKVSEMEAALNECLAILSSDAFYAGVLNTKKSAFDTNKTLANYYAVLDVISAAKPSCQLAKEKAKALSLGVAESDEAIVTADNVLKNNSTETEIAGAIQDLKVAEYNYVNANYAYSVALSPTAWVTTGETADNKGQHWDGTTTSTYKEQLNSNGTPKKGWEASAWEIGFEQTVTLPAGNYVFKVAGRKASGDGSTLELQVKNGDVVLGSVNDFPEGDTGKGIDTSGATNFGEGTYANNGNGRGWEWRYVKFALDDATDVKVAVNAKATVIHQWISFCNYSLLTDNEANVSLIAYNVALGAANTAKASNENVKGIEKAALLKVIADDATLDKNNADAINTATTALDAATTAFNDAKGSYDALADAIASSTAITTAVANVGTALFKHPESAKTALETATEMATTAWNATDATAASANAAAATLNAAIETYNTTINAPEAGKPYVIKNNTASGVLKIADNTVTVNAGAVVFFTAVTGGYVLSNADGAYISKKSGDNWTLETTTESSSAYVVNVNIVEGGYTIKGSKGLFGTDNTTAGSAVYANKTQANNGVWTIEEGASATMAVKANKWGTFIAPFDVTIPAGVAAYKVKGVVNGKFMDKEAVETTIPANTPVVLNNTTDADVSRVFNGINTATADSYKVGLLTGVYTAETVSAGNYVLQTQDGVQGFYVVKGNALTAVPNRCYLTLPIDANVRALFFSDGETTAIEGLDAQTSGDYDAIYTASGVQVNALQKGLNIVVKDGKSHKIYVK